jgi:hypothetical protein
VQNWCLTPNWVICSAISLQEQATFERVSEWVIVV